MKLALFVLLMGCSGVSVALACDPNENCTRNLIIGTADDPICIARRAICRVAVCSDIKHDADKYILNAQTEIRNSSVRKSQANRIYTEKYTETKEHDEEISEIEIHEQMVRSSLQTAEALISSQTAILEFVKLIKSEDAEVFQSNENVIRLIEDRDSKAEGVEYLKMYISARTKILEIDTYLKDSEPTGSINELKQIFEFQLIELSLRKGKLQEKRNKVNSECGQAIMTIFHESSFQSNQQKEIQRQESRKCK